MPLDPVISEPGNLSEDFDAYDWIVDEPVKRRIERRGCLAAGS
jgi:hypothetical protein